VEEKFSQNRRTPPSFSFLIGFPDLFLVLRNHTCLSLFILTFPGSPCAMDVPIRSGGGGQNWGEDMRFSSKNI